jgi:hypothetical protein
LFGIVSSFVCHLEGVHRTMTKEPNSLSNRIHDLNTPLPLIETAQGTNGGDTESTIFQTISARYQKQINCLAVDSTGRYAALGGSILFFRHISSNFIE